MKLRNQLIEESLGRAMSVWAIIQWWQLRARCVRCDHYDKKHRVCGSEGEFGGVEIWNPADVGCTDFSG
jgi:hypothetical protein